MFTICLNVHDFVLQNKFFPGLRPEPVFVLSVFGRNLQFFFRPSAGNCIFSECSRVRSSKTKMFPAFGRNLYFFFRPPAVIFNLSSGLRSEAVFFLSASGRDLLFFFRPSAGIHIFVFRPSAGIHILSSGLQLTIYYLLKQHQQPNNIF